MPRKGSEIVDVDVELIHETDAAWLVSPDSKRKAWVPKSVGEMEKAAGARMYTLTLPRQMAEDKELV